MTEQSACDNRIRPTGVECTRMQACAKVQNVAEDHHVTCVTNVTISRAYKTELDLNNAQITACKRHAGAARFAYNWGLARKQEAYTATGTSPSAIELHRELNVLKQTELS